MKLRAFFVTLAAAMLVHGSVMWAQQESAVIRGAVTGPDGIPASDTAVSLLDQLGFVLVTTTTDGAGRFRFEHISPGSYTVRADAPPRGSDLRTITVRAALPIDVELRLRSRLAEFVDVTASSVAPSVTTRMTIAGEAIRQAPARLSSRGVQELLSTLPGWADEDNGLLHVRGVDDGFLYVEDGMPVYDRIDTLFGIAPDPSAIGSLNVITGFIPPEYGLKSGAVIEVQMSAARPADWRGDFDAALGSDALRGATAYIGGPITSSATLGLSLASERSDRFLDPVHPGNFHNTGGVFSGQTHLTFVPSAQDLVRVNVNGGRSRFDVPHGEIQEEARQDQRQQLVQHSQSVSWQRFWSGAIVSQVGVYRRHISGELRDSIHDIPLSASSDRRQERLGMLAGVTYQRGRHTLKLGAEAARLSLEEDFSFAVTDEEAADAAEISEAAAAFTPANPFRFHDRADPTRWAFYAQDSVQATERFPLHFGVRYDSTRLLVPASQWSPRIGAAYRLPGGATTLRASVNRLFQPPQPEHLLLSSSPAARALSPFADEDGDDASGGAELKPERQTAWEAGVEQSLAGVARLDVAYWSRHVRNYADPNVFFGTTIIFPNSVAEGRARGLDVRLELARYRRWSSYVSYTHSKVEQVGPINGGLFLEENILEIGPGTSFTPDHDQRHVAAAGISYRDAQRGFSASISARYASGTPLEVEDDDLADLMDRPGAALVDFERGRVRPRTVVDASVSQRLHRGARTEMSLWLGVLNLTDRAYALNFGNPFSGTHFGAPRTVRAELRLGLR